MPFDNVWLKIDRAKEHVDDLESEIAAYFASGPYEVITDDDPQTGHRVLKIGEIRQPLPDRIRLLAGDAAHSLRAALDHFAYSAVPNPTENTAFPIWRSIRRSPVPSAQQLLANTRSKMHGASKDLTDAVASLQTYPGGNAQQIWAVDYLDITDKHRLLLAVGTAYQAITIDFGFFGRRTAAMPDNPFNPEQTASLQNLSLPVTLGVTDREQIQSGTVLFSAPPEDFDDYKESKFTLAVAFAEPAILHGERLVPTLRTLIDEVQGLLQRLVPLV